MTIDCRTALSLRDDYLHGRGPVGLVEAHVAECPACLDAFIESGLATRPLILPPEGFIVATPSQLSAANVSRRRVAVLGTSGVIGLACAWMASVVFVPGDVAAPLHLAASGRALVLAVAMMMEFAVVLLVPGIVRSD